MGNFAILVSARTFMVIQVFVQKAILLLEKKSRNSRSSNNFQLEVLENLRHGYFCNGVINLDIFLPDDEEPILKNVTPGSPGIYKSRMFEMYQGINLNQLHLKLQIGSPEIRLKNREDWKYSACSIHPRRDGIVTEIEKPIFISDAKINWHIYPGSVISWSNDNPAIAILLNNKKYSVLELDLEVAFYTNFYQVNNSNLLQLEELRRKNKFSNNFYSDAGGSIVLKNMN